MDDRPLIVVTRPREGAETFAAGLEAQGYEVLIEPLLTIVPRPAVIPPLHVFDAIAFTSANGARAFARLNTARDLPAYAVGQRTAVALQAAGFHDIRCRSMDAAGLARAIAAELPSGARVLHASGTAVAQNLADLLAASGIAVERVPLYDAVPAARLSQPLVDALYACTVQSVLFFSARTAEVFGTLVSRRSLIEACRSVTALCLSPAVAAKAALLPWDRITVAAEPTAEALSDLLPRRNTDMAGS